MFKTEPVYDAKSARTMENRMKKNLGIPRLLLLEAAGLMSAKSIQTHFPTGLVTIITGYGEKAAVGFATARHLFAEGRQICLINTVERRIYKGNTKTMWMTIKKLDCNDAKDIPRASSVIVDAILGTEFTGKLSPKTKKMIVKMNKSLIPIVALDIPTGLSSDLAAIPDEIAVMASRTLCFGFKRICHVLYPAASYVGFQETLSLGLIHEMKNRKSHDMFSHKNSGDISCKIESVFSCHLPGRINTGHKNTFGHTLVIGGSSGYLGAPILAGVAALGVGVGLVTVVMPEKAMQLGSPCYPPELMVTTPTNSQLKFQARDADFILRLISKKKITSIAIGMGIGDHTIEFLENLLTRVSVPVVIDGEALAIFSKKIALKSELVFGTPHPGEFQKYFSPSSINPTIFTLEKTAKKLHMQLAYKSVTPIVTDSERTFVFEKSYSSLAKAGSGDVLSGIIAGLAGQGFGKLSLPAAVWIHHAAGKKLHEKALDYAATAQDIAVACREIVREISS